MAMSSLDKRMKAATNEHLRKIYNTTDRGHTPKRKGSVKKHNCLLKTTKSEASFHSRPDSSSSRPSTRRNSKATPKQPLPVRSYSMGPSKFGQIFKFRQKRRPSGASSRSNNSEVHNANLQLDLQQTSDTSPNSIRSHLRVENDVAGSQPSRPAEDKLLSSSKSSEEHEYLLFLLRITEDIISNDFYSNNDIKKIFKNHMELNRDRLNMKKMRIHIANLCTELNIDCKEYQIPEVSSDESDSPSKYQNSPSGHNYILNNNAFKNCQDCSVIRTSSLYQMHSAEYCAALGDSLGLGAAFTESIGDSSSISPSLLKLLEKLSLGRVTECTEPVASTSTMNSPRLNLPNNLETDEINNFDDSKGPVDFDTFIKELNFREEASSVPPKDYIDLISSESPPPLVTITEENRPENADLSKNKPILIVLDLSPHQNLQNLESPKLELAKKENDIHIDSEKFESELKKCSSNNSIIKSGRNVENNEECVIKNIDHQALGDNSPHITEEISINKLKEPLELQGKTIKPSTLPIPLKEKPSQTCFDILKIGEANIVSSKCSIVSRVSTEAPHMNLGQIEESESESTITNQVPLSFLKIDESPIQSSKSSQIQLNDSEESNISVNNKGDEYNSKTPLKLILQGTICEDDYVMIKGPVYVYKPLLECEPKLIVFANNDADENSRRNSLDSQHSHRTFTVDHSQVIDETLQYNASLRSLEPNTMDNILKLTKTVYSQFADMKLLEEDYDLTPEKDESDNKYHHLMVDATTSISGVNITENLLLSDDYLVDTGRINTHRRSYLDDVEEESEKHAAGDINGYVKFEPNMYENNYVLHKQLVSSISMPKLKSKRGRLTSDRSYAGRKDDLSSRNGLKKSSTDLIDLDPPSQDSSIRSEGETFQCAKDGIAWSLFYTNKN